MIGKRQRISFAMSREQETISAAGPLDLYEGIVTAPPVLVVVYGTHLGRTFYLQRPEQVVGRDASCDIHLDEDSVSRRHARIAVAQNVTTIVDLGAKNGLFVNGHRVREAVLENGDRLHIGETVLKYLFGRHAESKFHEDIYRLMTVDDLTQAYNRQYFHESLKREMSRVQRYRRILSLAILDIDQFKDINDTHGHLAGDEILKGFAAIVSRHVRQSDLLARYGGDEFVLILPEADEAAALNVCEKLRALVASYPFSFDGHPIAVTTSIGLQTYDHAEGEMTVRELIAAADSRLYKAKKGGRNRICAGGTGPSGPAA